MLKLKIIMLKVKKKFYANNDNGTHEKICYIPLCSLSKHLMNQYVQNLYVIQILRSFGGRIRHKLS